MLELPKRITVPEGKDRAALKYAVLEALKNLHPDLYFDVKNIKYDTDGFFFGVSATVRRPPEALREVADAKGLRTMERIGEFSLVDYCPGRKKPYILRRKDGETYEAGESFVQKVFSKKANQVEAMLHIRKVMG